MRAAAVRYGPVFALTLLGAVLRFPTLDRQSFWLDELVTASLLDRSLGDVLGEIPRTEATPYLYYVVAWLWSSVFGLGEVGLRSLSALAGTATIPVAYGAGVRARVATRGHRRRGARRDQPVPRLVLAGGSLVRAVRAARSDVGARLRARAPRRRVAGSRGGRVVSALTLATHYFGVFLVGAEAVWLLAAPRGRGSRSCSRRSSRSRPSSPISRAPRPAWQRRSGRGLVARGEDRRDPEEPRRRLQLSARGRGQRRSPRCSSLLGLVLVARLTPARAARRAGRGLARGRGRARPVVLAAVGRRLRHRAERDRRRRPGRGLRRSRARVEAARASRPPCCCARSAPRSRSPRRSTRRTAAPTGAAQPRRSGRPTASRAVVVTPYMSRSLWRPYLPGLRRARAGTAPSSEEIAAVGLATEGGYSAGHVEPPSVGTPRAGPGLPGRRRRAKADVHARPLPRRPADLRPDRRRSPASR